MAVDTKRLVVVVYAGSDEKTKIRPAMLTDEEIAEMQEILRRSTPPPPTLTGITPTGMTFLIDDIK